MTKKQLTKSNTSWATVLTLGLCLLWACVSLWMTYHILIKELPDNLPALLILVAPLSAALLIYNWLKDNSSLRRYGAMPIKMDPNPASIGGHFGGRIEFKLPNNAKVEKAWITLTCYENSRTGSSTSTMIQLWETSMIPKLEFSNNQHAAYFCMDIDPDLPPSRKKGTDEYEWVAGFRATLDNSEVIFRRYVIQVKEEKRHSSSSLRFAHQTNSEETCSHFQAKVERALNIQKTNTGVVLFQPAFYYPEYLIIAILGLLSIALGWWINTFIYSAIIASLGFIGLLFGLYRYGSSNQVNVAKGSITIVRKLWAVTLRNHTIKTDEAINISIQASRKLTKALDSTNILQYSINATDLAQRTITILEDLNSPDEAKAARKIIIRHCNIDR